MNSRRVSPKDSPAYVFNAYEASGPGQYEELLAALGEYGRGVELVTSHGAYIGMSVPTPNGTVRFVGGPLVALTDDYGNITVHPKVEFDAHFEDAA